MTQLTFNQKPALLAQKPHRPQTSECQSEETVSGNADAYMARVSRNSLTGRRRHASDQPDGQHNTRHRPEDTRHETMRTFDGPVHVHAQYQPGTAFAVLSPQEQFTTNQTHYFQPAGLQTRSPTSYASPDSPAVGITGLQQPLLTSAHSSKYSASRYTPSHSPYEAKSEDSVSAFLTLRSQSDHSFEGNENGSLRYGVSSLILPSVGAVVTAAGVAEPLAGIDAIVDTEASDWSFVRSHESTPSSNMMLPSGLQHVRDLDEPWSPLEADDGASTTTTTPSRPPPSHSRPSQPPVVPTIRMPSRAGGRAGRRQGPLSQESRQNANDVRKERSCLRCFVYKETCDTSKDICQNCSNKQARTWKLGCVRPRLMFRTNYLLPDVLASRLERRYVDSFIQHKGWTCRDKPRFAVPLDIGLGPPLLVPVREFLPIGDLNRPAYLPIGSGKASTAVPISMYDLPVVISCDKEEEAANHIRHSLLKWFQQTIDCTHEGDWAWHWFSRTTDVFAGNVMNLICEYFRTDLVQHRLLKEALALSFFNYIFIYSFNVPDDHVSMLQKRLETEIPPDAQYISPSIINLYIKMLMLPPLRDVVKRTLKGLEVLLLDQQNARLWRRDLTFCVSFIVLAYLGRTQVSVVQFANQPSRDSSNALTHQAAIAQVQEMEAELADLVINYHKQFLTPSPRRKASSTTASEFELASEEHAQSFQLMDKIRKLKSSSLDNKPQSLEPQCGGVGDFIANNTSRICWKFVEALLPGSDQDQQDVTMT